MNRQPATPPKLTHGRPVAKRSIKSSRRRGEQSDSEANMRRPARQSAAGGPAPLAASMQLGSERMPWTLRWRGRKDFNPAVRYPAVATPARGANQYQTFPSSGGATATPKYSKRP